MLKTIQTIGALCHIIVVKIGIFKISPRLIEIVVGCGHWNPFVILFLFIVDESFVLGYCERI
jgi:hypothetical protein